MKSFIKTTLTIIICSCIFSACNKKNELGKWIPKNALVIVHINEKSLTSKVSWNDIKQTSWFQKIYTDSASKTWIKNLLDNPDSSGIDASGDLVIFLQKNAASQNQVVVEGDLKDAKTFEAFNKHLDDKSSVTKEGNINLIALHNKLVSGWNDKKFVYVMNAPEMKTKSDFGTDSIAPAFRDSLNNSPKLNTQELSTICKNIFSLSSDMSMEKNERFGSLIKENGDIHIWQNTEAMMTNAPALGMMNMLKLDVFFKDNISTYTINFENGKISFIQKLYVGKELGDAIKKSGGGNLNADMIKNIPSQNVAGLFVAHFNPETIKNIITLAGIDGFVNLALAKQGITFDDIIKATKGDVLFAASDVAIKSNPSDTAGKHGLHENASMKFLFASAIDDKDAFNKLLNAGKKMTQNTHTDSTHTANNDKFFVMSNSQENISKYLAANANSKFDFTDKLSGHPVGGFVDIHKILLSFSSTADNDSTHKIVMDESIKTWDNLYITGGEFNDNAFTYNGEINLIDKNTNSLKQLNLYTDRIAKVMIEKDKKDGNAWHSQINSADDSSHKKHLQHTPLKK